MKIYLVGGAVRDRVLGKPVREKDWCVVGATPEDMIKRGYRKVGKDFPVFLHPETGEEYALARTERKTGPGYHGFEFDTSPAVTIEEDLLRRDLTVNAIAEDDTGNVIDPCGGVEDIRNSVLRHVSDAYREDPVRILRTARFYARFAAEGFTIAGETLGLMAEMVVAGEAAALVPDRVWKETELALRGPAPQLFFRVLQSCGALEVVFPELDALFGVPQPPKWHPEVDCGIHMLMVLEQAARISPELDIRFAALVHDLGKGTTPAELLPSHNGHEDRGVKILEGLSRRLPIPRACRELGALASRFHGHCHRAFELRPQTILKVLEKADAFRRPDRFEKFLLTCEADSKGRDGYHDKAYPQADLFRGAFAAANRVNVQSLGDNLEGPEIAEALHEARLAEIRAYRASLD
jgi:tRNA nucleotidyltransferase (CCA-adding enzyme)